MNHSNLKKTNPPTLHKPFDNLYAHVVSVDCGRLHRISGIVAIDAERNNLAVGDLAGQITAVYEQITDALGAVGCDWGDVIHIYTFTTDMDAYVAAERTIAPSYLGLEPPASTLVQVSRLVDREWLVEVQVDAVGGTDGS